MSSVPFTALRRRTAGSARAGRRESGRKSARRISLLGHSCTDPARCKRRRRECHARMSPNTCTPRNHAGHRRRDSRSSARPEHAASLRSDGCGQHGPLLLGAVDVYELTGMQIPGSGEWFRSVTNAQQSAPRLDLARERIRRMSRGPLAGEAFGGETGASVATSPSA